MDQLEKERRLVADIYKVLDYYGDEYDFTNTTISGILFSIATAHAMNNMYEIGEDDNDKEEI